MLCTGDSASAITRQRRNGTMDTIRFVLIFGVMVYHYTVRWRPPHNEQDLYGFQAIYNNGLELGAYGVHVFFMLSGFFISISIARYATATEFLYNRLVRIYPSFLICCTLTFALIPTMPTRFGVSTIDYLLSLGFLAENVGGRFVDGAYWSLAVEMKFYLFVCVSVAAMGRRYWVGLIALGLLGSIVGSFHPKVAKEILIAPYLPMFLAGVALSYQTKLRNASVAMAIYLSAAVLFVLHVDAITLDHEPSKLAAACVAAAIGSIIVLVSADVEISTGLTAYLGVISYEIYLLHQKIGVTIIGYARRNLDVPDVLAIGLAMLTVIGLAALVHEVLQKPFRTALMWGWRAWAGRAGRERGARAETPRS